MSKTILIADKDKNNRNFIKQIVNSIEQCVVNETDEAREFLHLAVNNTPDLIIMDVNIHAQSYEKLIEIIRSQHTKEKLPIIVISYAINKEKIIALLKLGIEDFILKPFTNNLVIEKLKFVMNKIRGTEGSIVDCISGSQSTNTTKESKSDTFLLIDHDRSFRDQFIRLFGEQYKIVTADNGEEGLNCFEKLTPQFVFISEHLKVINERVLVQKIRAICSPDTKIFFLSSVLKSSAMKSTLFNGVIEKSVTPAVFHKDFSKVVFGEEVNFFQKVSKYVRTNLPGHLNNIIKQSFKDIVKSEITVITPNEDFKIPNEALASAELIDEKKELSVTVGLYGSSKDMLFMAESVIGEPVPFNAQAVEALSGVISELANNINQQIDAAGIKLMVQTARVNSKLENKLNYDWDLHVFIKDNRNSHYVVGLYCSRYI